MLLAPLSYAQQMEGKKTSTEQDLPIEGNQVNLGLKNALMLGLKNNLNIAFQSYNPQIAATQIMRAESEYDTLLKSDFAKTA